MIWRSEEPVPLLHNHILREYFVAALRRYASGLPGANSQAMMSDRQRSIADTTISRVAIAAEPPGSSVLPARPCPSGSTVVPSATRSWRGLFLLGRQAQRHVEIFALNGINPRQVVGCDRVMRILRQRGLEVLAGRFQIVFAEIKVSNCGIHRG